jgi:hypothetical protein
MAQATLQMDNEEKKVYMLLKSVIFHYHGLDEEERINLADTARDLDAHRELAWANEFISEDYITSFERAREFLSLVVNDFPKEKRVEFIRMVWESNTLKGYVTEMEATAMLKLARDWHVDRELIQMIGG